MQSALSPLALIKKVVPLITDEAPFGIPDPWSHDWGYVDDIAPRVEATKARGNRKEEGSSSTLGKDDHEGNDTGDEDKIIDIADQQVEVQHGE